MAEEKMTKKEKIQRLREYLPLFWNSYQHMYDVRERNVKGMIDFLLIISTFLPILSITMYTTNLFNHPLILLPIIPQIISIIVLLKYFVVNTPAVHWFKLNEDLLKWMENGNFEVITITALKKLEGFTWISMREENKLIKTSRILILSSLLILVLSVLVILFHKNPLTYLSFLLVITGFCLGFVFYYQKLPNFSEEEKNASQHLALLNKWLEE